MNTQLPEELEEDQEQSGLSDKPPILQDEPPQEKVELKTSFENKSMDTAGAEAGKQEAKSQPVSLDTIASAKKPDTPSGNLEMPEQPVPVNVNKSWVGEETQQAQGSPYHVLEEAPPVENNNEPLGQAMVGSIDEPASGVSLVAKVGVLVLIIVIVAGGMAIVYGMTKGWDMLGWMSNLPGLNDLK